MTLDCHRGTRRRAQHDAVISPVTFDIVDTIEIRRYACDAWGVLSLSAYSSR